MIYDITEINHRKGERAYSDSGNELGVRKKNPSNRIEVDRR